jgi:FkbM family methyltransferase
VDSPTFASFSQNGEDVVLWRALHNVRQGRYIDVGANHPETFSVSMGFYNRGWSGITVEPDPAFAQMQRDERPRDVVVEAAITTKDNDVMTFHVVDGTGLSTLDGSLAQAHARAGYDTHEVEVATRRIDSLLEEAGWDGLDIHFMSIDTEGAERDVLESFDLRAWRPWVLVVEATAPLTTQSTKELWEALVLDAGYRFCLFDGLSCYYVAEEHAESLAGLLSYPACPHDDYTTKEYRDSTQRYQELAEKAAVIPELLDQVTRWRAQAVTRWAKALDTESELERLREEVADLLRMHHHVHTELTDMHKQIGDLRRSTSWRVTKPLRFVSGLARRTRHHQ